MYSDKVMDHFEHPRNVGEISDANAVGQVGNPKCGDIMKIYMKMMQIYPMILRFNPDHTYKYMDIK